MSYNQPKQLSSPFNTGGGGFNFEINVQAAFVALMLSGGSCPCLAHRWPIVEVGLQKSHRGYETDDAVVVARNDNTGEQCRLLVQVKHSIRFTEKDPQMPDVIGAAWRDFNKPSHFDPKRDAIALVTGPISKTDSENICRLLDVARGASDAVDFNQKILQSKTISDSQRKRLTIIRDHIANANGGTPPDAERLWKFLKSFYLIGFDLDLVTGVAISLIQSLIGATSPDDVEKVWLKIVEEVRHKNKDAGTLTRSSVSQPLQDCFKKDEIKPVITIAPSPIKETLALNLIGEWDESVEGDRAIVEALSGMAFADWQTKVREIWKEQGQ